MFQKGNKIGVWFKKGHKINKGRSPWNKDKKMPIELKIKFTNNFGKWAKKGFKQPKSHLKKKSKAFMGHKGFWLGKNKEQHPNWLGGKSFEPYTPNFNQQLKDRIRVRDNFICQLCGVPEIECNKRLAVHHIDYNKNNCAENNLISLCNSCHNKTTSRREYWKEYFNGQEQIIKSGKS